MSNLSSRIEIFVTFIITFLTVFVLQDYIFKYKVNQIIKENPNITLQEFMNYKEGEER